ncbi:nucleoside deaminase [Hydrogenimonas sp.]
MKIARREAEKGIEAGDGGPFGAVIVKDGKVIARGHNMVVKTNDPTAHAEIVAIRRASKKLGSFHLEGCILYVTGEPCPMCFAAIHWARIENVVYCNTKEEAAAIGFDDSLIDEIVKGKREDPVSFVHLPSKECRDLFRRWYENPQRVLY